MGSAAVLGDAACAAIAYAIVKRRSVHLPPTVMVATQTLFALLLLVPAALLIDGNPVSLRWTPAAVMALVQPLIAAVLGALILGKRFGVFAAIGGACILLSAAVILRKDAAV